MSIDADKRDGDLNITVFNQFHRYMNALSEEEGLERYRLGTVIEDLLYGIGTSIDSNKYGAAQGYRIFKADLIELLNKPERGHIEDDR